MSDYEDSTITYTKVSSPFADLSDIGSPGVDGPSVMSEDPYAYVLAAFLAPPSPDYVLGLEEPEQAPPSPVYVPYVLEPVYPEFMPPEDEVLPAEEQPLPAATSPTADLPGYDDNVDIEGDEEEEEHPTPADSTAIALPAVDYALSAEETKPFKIDKSTATSPPHPAYRVTNWISVRDKPPTPFCSNTEVSRLLAIPTPPPSPLSPWSSPLPQIPSPPLPPILSPLHVSSLPHASPTYPLGYKAAMIRLRAEAPSTSHSPPPHITLPHHSRYTSIKDTTTLTHTTTYFITTFASTLC
ncbi:hypothetical protein Tco_0523627 [Tanacetum coccineum]